MLTKLESAVLEALLAGDHPVLVGLRAQVPLLAVKAREVSSAGCFTEFTIADGGGRAPVSSERLVFGDVQATIPGLKLGAGFVLYVNKGLLHLLEGYTFDEPWPESTESFTLAYADPARRKVLATLDSLPNLPA